MERYFKRLFMKKLLLIINTLIHLRPIQIRYQIWYRVRKMWRKTVGFKYTLFIKKKGNPLLFSQWIKKRKTLNGNTFSFLNKSKAFPTNEINWNFSDYGKLWTYNLNYFDFLLQPEMDAETGLSLINQFIEAHPTNPTAIEPYPIALRGINWIKFISKQRHCEDDKGGRSNLNRINGSLYAQYQIILNNIEYHLLGNHLLEDGFSLLFGAFYFEDKKLYNKAEEIIYSELKEQILEDGAHFELSPMYHQIIIDRLLDCINLVQNNKRFETQDSLLDLMHEQAQKMLGWLNQITFNNGQIPLLNDSAPGIAPTTKQINEYAFSLNLKPVTLSEVEGRNLQLSSSGYRKFTGTNYECIIDIGQIGPTYQPGHAHADTFNFVLNVNNKPFIVDTGISTYDANSTRLLERGTSAHNTVTVSEENSSQVWSAFRVAQRANVEILQDEKTKVSAQHAGYKKLRTTHQRDWKFNKNKIEIIDTLTGNIKEGKVHFWLSPHIVPIKTDNNIKLKNITLTFTNAQTIDIIPVKIPNGYNQFQKIFKIEVSFKEQLISTMKIK